MLRAHTYTVQSWEGERWGSFKLIFLNNTKLKQTTANKIQY